MRRLFIFSFFLMLATGCGDGGYIGDLDETSYSKAVPKNKQNELNGIYYNMDSVEKYVIESYNDFALKKICNEIIEKTIRKNRKLEYSNELGEFYGFVLSKDAWDTLHHYNYQESDVSSTDKTKEIVLTGRDPYKEKGIYEDMVFNNTGLENKHPLLYSRAKTLFFQTEQPDIFDLQVDNSASTYVEYSIKVRYKQLDDQYIAFTVSAVGTKLSIKVTQKSDIK